MNATESMTEAYFRVVRQCLTRSDVKVNGGVGRQLDLLAYCPRTGEQFHVEISVKHNSGFNYTVDELMRKAERKFFGTPKRTGQKECLSAIKKTYASIGFDFHSVTRVWVPWIIHDEAPVERASEAFATLARKYGVNNPKFELILFRDQLLPELMRSIGTANYDDSIIRTLSLVTVSRKQRARVRRLAGVA